MVDKHEPPKADPKHEPHPAPGAKKEDPFATEQTKDPKGGVGPAEPSVPMGTEAKTMEDLGIGPRTPYPDGNPPKPDPVPATPASQPVKKE
jgi:hypothetical protein